MINTNIHNLKAKLIILGFKAQYNNTYFYYKPIPIAVDFMNCTHQTTARIWQIDKTDKHMKASKIIPFVINKLRENTDG